MVTSVPLLCTLCLVAVLQVAQPPQPVSPASFVGTWVGLQTVANNTSPGVQEGQTVTLTIEMVDGKLTGTLKPFFGGNDGASFVDIQIVGEELRASAVVGRPPSAAGGRGRGATGWKSDTKIQFALKADRTRLSGTGDIELSGVKWMQYSYDLEKKRARY